MPDATTTQIYYSFSIVVTCVREEKQVNYNMKNSPLQIRRAPNSPRAQVHGPELLLAAGPAEGDGGGAGPARGLGRLLPGRDHHQEGAQLRDRGLVDCLSTGQGQVICGS